MLLIAEIEEHWDLPASGSSRTGPLVRHFITGLALSWTQKTGRRPGKGRTGPFARLVAHAWRFVGFKAFVDDDQLESWIGGRIEEVLQDEYQFWDDQNSA